MNHTLSIASVTFGLFIGMLLLLEIGRRIGERRMLTDPEAVSAAVGAVDGAVFGLLGLLVAFSFAGAASRFDARRHLILEEVHAIGTAYLRLDLLPESAQPALRESFHRYVDARLALYRRPDIGGAKAELARAAKLQEEIWSQAVAACRAEGTESTTMLLLPALNAMIDSTTTQTMTAQTHPPIVIFAMLFGLALASSLLAGYSMATGRSRSWIHMLGFAAAMAAAVYVILDIELPRLGLIRIDAFDQVLVDLRDSLQ